MRRIIVSMFVSLDGVTEDPQKWSLKYWNEDINTFKREESFGAGAMLLGRITYEGFAASWPSRSGDFADLMNNMPKFVASTTLETLEWNNSTVINGDVPDGIAKLKREPGQDLLVFGSMTLVDTLMRHDLVDEYRLLIYPVVLGAGKRMFKDGTTTKMTLREAKALDQGVVLLTYAPAK